MRHPQLRFQHDRACGSQRKVRSSSTQWCREVVILFQQQLPLLLF
jgi:hypothetical protein